MTKNLHSYIDICTSHILPLTLFIYPMYQLYRFPFEVAVCVVQNTFLPILCFSFRFFIIAFL